MKLHLCLLPALFVLLTTELSAQSYSPMPDSNAYWKKVRLVFAPGQSYSHVIDEYIDGDTVISSNTYHKIYNDEQETDNPGNIVTVQTHVYIGAMRDDIPGRKVYYKPVYPDSVFLLYDFNLTVGQHLPQTYTYHGFNDSVTSIDSVFFNHRYHRRYWTSADGCGPYYFWMEGMGSNLGLTEVNNCSGSLSQLNCFYQDDRACWPDTTTGCASAVGIAEQGVASQLNITPVPAYDHIVVHHPQANAGGMISIYDATGKLLMSMHSDGETPVTISVLPFTPGIYLLLYTNGDGYAETRKFVVE